MSDGSYNLQVEHKILGFFKTLVENLNSIQTKVPAIGKAPCRAVSIAVLDMCSLTVTSSKLVKPSPIIIDLQLHNGVLSDNVRHIKFVVEATSTHHLMVFHCQ